MIKYIQREVRRIEGYPTHVIDFMLNATNWVEVDPDSVLGAYHLISYPEQIAVLNLSNADEDVKAFFDKFPNPQLHKMIIEDAAMDEDLLDHDSDSFIEDDVNINCVFAYFYADTGEEDTFNNDKFEDDNQVYIYNGLSEDENYVPDEFAHRSLNVSDITLF